MKYSFFILSLLCPLLFWAKPINPQIALQVAENFINTHQPNDTNGVRRAPTKPIKLAKVTKQITTDQQFYIFQYTDGEGYIIVSADDIARPILGFSDAGNLDNNIPENLRWWLSEYDREIKWALEQGFEQDVELQAEWEELKNAPKVKKADFTIGPLISTEWSQGTWYNNKCPYDSNKQTRCVTGCVATAMAQIMKYWNFPANGRGNHSYIHDTYGLLSADFEHTTYNWANMPNDLNILSYSSQIDAIATLMYHCGVAVNMNYGTDASGAKSSLVPRAMRDYFWYSDEAVYLSKDDFTPAEWRSMLFEELWEGRPVFYSGGNMLSGGSHAFICDGWRSDDYFHFNWGWDKSNGYYSLTSLKPTYFFISNGDYTASQAAIFNLYPKSDTISRYRLELEDKIYISDSIPYGSKWHIDAFVENAGFKTFSGYIYAVIEDKDWWNPICIDSVYFDSNNRDILTFDIDSAANLPVDKYYFSLMYRDSITGNLVRVCSDYHYSNHVPVIVYNPLERADEYDFPEGWYYPNIYLTEDSIEITTAVRNTGKYYLWGEIALLFVNASDSTISQYFDTLSLESSPISPYKRQEISFKGILNIPEGNYLVYLLYRPDTTVDWGLIEAAEIFNNPEDFVVLTLSSKQEYYIVAKRTSGNYYFFTPEKVSGKNRLVAVDAGTSERTSIDTINTTSDYLWSYENFKLQNHNGQYLACTEAKSAIMNGSGTELFKTENSDGSVTFYYITEDLSETRYLSLALAGNDYFVFYANANQITHLLMLPKGKGSTTSVTNINVTPEATKILYNGQILILRGEKTYTLTGQEIP